MRLPQLGLATDLKGDPKIAAISCFNIAQFKSVGIAV
jgi:hypothetical protein